MGLKEFKIIFNNPYKVYYAGEKVKVRVLVVLDSPKKIQGITVKVTGEANTNILKGNERQRSRWRLRSNQDDCSGHESYLSIKHSIFEDIPDEETDLVLEAGEYLYPFEFDLPPNLPSSLESSLGHIRYRIESTIDRPWKFNHEIKESFTVFSNYDLNNDPKASEEVLIEGSKNFITFGSFGCCYSSAPFAVNFTLPVRGYVPGQSIPIKVNIKNESGIEVSVVKLSLERYVTHRANNPRSVFKTKCFTINEICKCHIEHNRIMTYRQNLKVPSLPPSSLNHDRIIDVRYAVKLEAMVDGWCHNNLVIDSPILIGTVPLVNYNTLAAPPKHNYPRKDPPSCWNSVTSAEATLSLKAPPSSTASPPSTSSAPPSSVPTSIRELPRIINTPTEVYSSQFRKN